MPKVLSDVNVSGLPDAAAAPAPGAQALVDLGFTDVLGGKWGLLGGAFQAADNTRADGLLVRPAAEAARNVRVEAYLSAFDVPVILAARYTGTTHFRVHFTGTNMLGYAGTGLLGYLATYDAVDPGPVLLRMEVRDNPAGGTDVSGFILSPDGATVLRQGTIAGTPYGPQEPGRGGLDAYYNYGTHVYRHVVTDLDAASTPPPLAPVTLGRDLPTRTQVFLGAPAIATGTAPLTHRWQRQFSLETPADLGVDGETQTDTPPDGRAYKYTLVTTDATGASVTSGPITAARRAVRNLFLDEIGDSITYGDQTVPLYDGLRDSPPSRMVRVLAGLGDREWVDSTLAPADKRLKSVVHNAGASGWGTANFLDPFPGDPTGRSWLQVTLDNVIGYRDEVDPDALIAVGIRLGANDTNITVAQYQANLTAMCQEVTGRGWPCLLHYPPPSVSGDRPAIHAAQHQAIDELIAAGVALAGDRESYALIARHWPDWYLPAGTGGTDEIHPGPAAWQAMADAAANAWGRAVLLPIPAGGATARRRAPILRRGR